MDNHLSILRERNFFQIELVRYAFGLNPVCRIISFRIRRQPIGGIRHLVVIAMPRIINQKPVIRVEVHLEPVDLSHDGLSSRFLIENQCCLESIIAFKYLGTSVASFKAV